MRRVGFLALTIVVTSLIIFTISQVLPGDVCRVILGREVGDQALADCRADLGLDDPLIVRYVTWLSDFTQGDWGTSYSTRTEIRPSGHGTSTQFAHAGCRHIGDRRSHLNAIGGHCRLQ